MITQARLKEVLHYNKESGIFVWHSPTTRRVKKGDIAGNVNDMGYIRIRVDGKSYRGHRLAWLYVYGKLPEKQIDHINHNRADNRIENLREVNNIENSKNHSIGINNTSGVVGVYWCNTNKRWKATIKINYKSVALGIFTCFSDAVNARKNAEVMYGFHKNHGNTSDCKIKVIQERCRC